MEKMLRLRISLPLCMGLLCLFLRTQHAAGSFPYYGTKIGALKRLHHGVSGDVYAVDSRTIFIKKFNYDGEAPAAYFYVGNTDKPSNEGASRLRDERGGNTALQRRYRNKDITLSLPDGKTLRDFKWFSVWCDEFAVNFGDVNIPANLDFPRPQKITGLRGVHDVNSDNIVIVDAQTLLVPNFSYDGEAPDAKFWVGRGQRPSPQGVRIPDENGTENPLRRYEKKTIVLTLPGDLTIFDIGHFGVWCEAFTVDFGHVRVPEGLNVPPSLKMLGISPQSKLNCEVLYDDLAFEVRWAVAGESIVVQLVAKLAENEYMSFGISPSKDRSVMIGSDVVVAWVDRSTGKGYAQDYYLDDKSQCSGSRGTCPDVNIEDNTNSIRLLNAAMVNGYSIVTYQRSLQATDRLDLPISINGTEAIVWAIGPLNERREASFHSHFTKRTHYIEFGRQPTWNCPMPESSSTAMSSDQDDEDDDEDEGVSGSRAPSTASSIGGYPPTSGPEEEFYENRPQALQQTNRRQSSGSASNALQSAVVPTPKPANTNGAWDIPAIQCFEPEDGVFYAQMGPTGGKHGYPAITGHVGWGISWYINGLLIPEIHVVRGKTYTFVVEGGNNPDIPAKYHPFYITDDPVGGYEHKREEEKKAIRIFAGVHRSRSGQVTPIGVGRLCNWTPDIDGPPADDYQSFGAYQRTLTLKCETGEPGVITWTPDANTPDTVYYHCYTHRYLGWKIHVHDACDGNRHAVGPVGAASERHETRIAAPERIGDKIDDEFVDELDAGDEGIAAAASIRHESKVSPNANFLLKHQTDLIKNHNMNGTPPKLSFEITKSTEITKLISDGIRAAEALEQSILRQSSSSNTNNNNNNTSSTINNNIYNNNSPYSNSNINNNNSNQQSYQKQKTKLKTNNNKAVPIGSPNSDSNSYNNNHNDISPPIENLQGEQHAKHSHYSPNAHAHAHENRNQTSALTSLAHLHQQQLQLLQQYASSSPLAHVHYAHYHPQNHNLKINHYKQQQQQKQQQHFPHHPHQRLQHHQLHHHHHHHPHSHPHHNPIISSPSSHISHILYAKNSNQSNVNNLNNNHNNNNNVPAQLHTQTIGLSEYLRPPQNAPLFHPVKLPGRRPPPPAPPLPSLQASSSSSASAPPSSSTAALGGGTVPLKKLHGNKPTIVLPQQLPVRTHQHHQQHPHGGAAGDGGGASPANTLGLPIPQPSVIVNHYRKPVPTLLRPFFKEPAFPIQPLAASVLLLGQPTELQQQQHIPADLAHMKHVKVPYGDLVPQGSKHSPMHHGNVAIAANRHDQQQKPPAAMPPPPSKSHKLQKPSTNETPAFKQPFDVHAVVEEPSSQALATMQPAVNKGFIPDSVVVESGFRPITRRDGVGGDAIAATSTNNSGSTNDIPASGADHQLLASDRDGDEDDDSDDEVGAHQPFASRREDLGSEIDEAMETDTLFLLRSQKSEAQQTQHFEPMFIPSPPDSTNATQSAAVLQLPLALQRRKQIEGDLITTMGSPIAVKLRDPTRNEAETSAVATDDGTRTDESVDAPTPLDAIVRQEDEQDEPITTIRTERDNHGGHRGASGGGRGDDRGNNAVSHWGHTLYDSNNNNNNGFDDLIIEEELGLGDDDDDDDENDDDDYGDSDDVDEREAQAAERIDTYYLPPDNRKIPDAMRLIPSGAVVTYDGKSVIDSSLVLPPKLDAPHGEGGGANVRHLSKIEELIRTTPQFVPFRGEIPPAITEFLSTERSKSSQSSSPSFSSSSSRTSTTHAQARSAAANFTNTTASTLASHTISTLSLTPPLPSAPSQAQLSTHFKNTGAYNRSIYNAPSSSSASSSSSTSSSSQRGTKVTKLHISNS